MTLIELKEVYKSYGAIKAIQRISARVENGSSLCIVGPSGCGKTTLLKVMALITQPDKGSVIIDGVAVTNPGVTTRPTRFSVSYSFQEPLLLPYLSAVDNIVLVLGGPTREEQDGMKEKTIELLSRFHLENRLTHLPSKLSVGEKKRVDLARALMRGTPIIIADEPLASLDPDAQTMVMTAFDEFVIAGGIFVYSSVEPTEAKYASNTLQLAKIGAGL